MLAANPVAWKLVTPAPTVDVTKPEPNVEFVARSMAKPVSFDALSVHARLIWALEAAVAVRFEGAAGG